MKAWIVFADDVSISEVVFAETAGTAKTYALVWCDEFEWSAYTELHARRLKKADHLWNGRDKMEWENEEDRIFLVKECGWSCDTDYWMPDTVCKDCPAAQWCAQYQDWLKEREKDDAEIH